MPDDPLCTLAASEKGVVALVAERLTKRPRPSASTCAPDGADAPAQRVAKLGVSTPRAGLAARAAVPGNQPSDL